MKADQKAAIVAWMIFFVFFESLFYEFLFCFFCGKKPLSNLFSSSLKT